MRDNFLNSLILLCSFITLPFQVCAEDKAPFNHPLYLGVTAGYGNTTWEGLVPAQDESTAAALNISTPIYVSEGGAVWGFFGGYEFSPYFALEGSYMRFPGAEVMFDPVSLFSFENDGRTIFRTNTEMLALMGKVMLVFPGTNLRLYSGAGVANVHRKDEITNCWRASPTFGVGLNYIFKEHIMGEFGANYTAGYGESELSPAEDYIPFLYSVFFRLAYRF